MNKLPVTVCLISGAEAHRIGKALASVADWASEIVIVLNEEVKDGTEEIAKSYQACIYREPWKGFREQKNSSITKASQPWILSLDADEVVSESLQVEIREVLGGLTSPIEYAGFAMPRCSWYCGRWIRHGDWYPDLCVRLWKKGSGRWEGADPHPRVVVKGRMGRFRHDLEHHSMESINQQIAKTVDYADTFVQGWPARGRAVTWADLSIRPAWRFVRAYVIKLGFLDGWQGYSIAWLTAFYTFLRYARVREIQGEHTPDQTPLSR